MGTFSVWFCQRGPQWSPWTHNLLVFLSNHLLVLSREWMGMGEWSITGWWLSKTTPLKNDGVSNSWDDDIPNWMEIHKNSMVPLLIIISYYIPFKTPLYPIIPNIWESQKTHVPNHQPGILHAIGCWSCHVSAEYCLASWVGRKYCLAITIPWTMCMSWMKHLTRTD